MSLPRAGWSSPKGGWRPEPVSRAKLSDDVW